MVSPISRRSFIVGRFLERQLVLGQQPLECLVVLQVLEQTGHLIAGDRCIRTQHRVQMVFLIDPTGNQQVVAQRRLPGEQQIQVARDHGYIGTTVQNH